MSVINSTTQLDPASKEAVAERLRWARQRHGQYASPTDAARAFGWVVSTYLGHENGDRRPTRARAKRYARAYRVRWEWLLEGEGEPVSKTQPINVIGEVAEHAEVRFFSADQVFEIDELPITVGRNTVALVMLGGSMRGVADDNWLFFYEDAKSAPTKNMLGKLCVVALADSRVLIRTVQPGRRKNRYDLESPTEATMRDQRIEWIAPITWIKPR